MARSGRRRRLAALAEAEAKEASSEGAASEAEALGGGSEAEGSRLTRRSEEESGQAASGKKLKVLLLGRLNPRRAGGGIARSAHLIARSLRAVGNTVLLRDSREACPIPRGTSIVMHYSDMEGVSEHIDRAAAAGVPIIVNASHDGTSRRCDWIHNCLTTWRPGVRMFVFSSAARDDPRLAEVRERLVVLPKTIRTALPRERPDFFKREGICLGELEKARKARIVGAAGIDALLAVRLLKRAMPDVPLHFYNQYSPKGRDAGPPQATVHGYKSRGFVSWLGRFRLYISLSRHETFAMVPAEAQSMGTVVLYRHQPQSLSEYLGLTGVSFESARELVLAAKTLYHDPVLWEQYSQMSRYNALARGHMHVGAALEMALRKAML